MNVPSYQQNRFIVPAESAGADRVLFVPEDSGSHRHREVTCIKKPQIPYMNSKLRKSMHTAVN